MDQPDGAVALQNVLAHSVPGGDRRSPRPRHAQDHLREVRGHPPSAGVIGKTTLRQLISAFSLLQSVQEHPDNEGRGASAGDRRRRAQLRGLPVITDTRPHSEGHPYLPALHRQPGPQTP